MSDLIIDPASTTSAPRAQATAHADLIRESDTQNFQVDVLEASLQTPVLVDFWAPWCGPCKTLGPLLEKQVMRAGGLVKMVKINVDDNQALAAQLRVQSVPTVFAFKDGQPVDAFAGALPESQIQAFIQKLIGDAKPPIEAAMEAAHDALKSGDPRQAEDLYTDVLTQDPTAIPAFAGVLRAIAAQGDVARGREMLSKLDDKTLLNADVQQAISALDLAEQCAQTDAGALDDLQRAVDIKPTDLEARFALAQALFSAGQVETAIDHLLEIVKQDRAWNDEAGRKQLLKIFDTIGQSDPITTDARSRLSVILFS